MRRRSLTDLASNPDLIPGIYNYCDRWCERCPLTSRCLVYATEQEESEGSPESNDINNEAFWRKLGDIFRETREMIAEWAEEAGLDLTACQEEENAQTRKRRRQQVDYHPLAKAGKEYANDVTEWFRVFDQTIELSDLGPNEGDIEDAERLSDAREILYWYQYQIAVKTMRALSGRGDDRELEEEFGTDGFPRDSDGSAKVALIGIDRSIAAWRMMQLSVPDQTDSIVAMILQLERLRNRLEKAFPNARDFVRPGFDEILGAAN